MPSVAKKPSSRSDDILSLVQKLPVDFYQKHAKPSVPDAVRRFEAEEDGKTVSYMFVRDLSGLLALAQLGVLEVHTWPCHADKIERPDQFVFDLDPDPGLA